MRELIYTLVGLIICVGLSLCLHCSNRCATLIQHFSVNYNAMFPRYNFNQSDHYDTNDFPIQGVANRTPVLDFSLIFVHSFYLTMPII